MRYNEAADTVISSDGKGVIEYWSAVSLLIPFFQTGKIQCAQPVLVLWCTAESGFGGRDGAQQRRKGRDRVLVCGESAVSAFIAA